MIKGLIENECAGQNSLVKLASHFTNSNEQKLTQDAIRNLRSNDHNSSQLQLTSDGLVNEYLGLEHQQQAGPNSRAIRAMAPRTFHMETLFNELKHIDKTPGSSINNNNASLHSTTSTSSSLQSSSAAKAADWSQDPLWNSITNAVLQKQQQQQQAPFILDDRSYKWSTDYLAQSETNILDEAWENILLKNSNQEQTVLFQNQNLLSKDFANNSENLIETNKLNEEMRKTANELLDSMQDSRFSETEFLQFVRNLSVNALNNNNSDKTTQFKNQLNNIINETNSKSTGGDLFLEEENLNFDLNDDKDLATEWVKEFQNLDNNNNNAASNTSTNTNSSDLASNDFEQSYWNELQNEWNSIASENPNHSWLDDFQKVFDTYKTYEFDKENPLKMHPNPFEEGLERLKVHDIVNAVLLFEVAVQKEPNNMLAWEYLGKTQVENEQDPQAIRALRKCLELKPDNLVALSTLATSYTNESMQRLAFDSLIKWIKHHPDYSHLLKGDEQANRLLAASEQLNQNLHNSPYLLSTLGIVNANDFMDLQEIYLKAVRESANKPNRIDPDLQCCLGVLFHLSGEYDKAADCFKTALQIKPNDHLLWNKLGATFANNNRNEEAIDSYYQALKLCPGFVRARYNLGIGCMNLGAYKEAVEHFLTALIQQSQANIADYKLDTNINTNKNKNLQQMSETIWSTLRLALSYLNRTDLYQACLTKNIDQLKKEFNI